MRTSGATRGSTRYPVSCVRASSVAKSCGSSIAAISWRSWTTSGTHLCRNACGGCNSRTAARLARSSIALGALEHRAGRDRDAELEAEVHGERLEVDHAVLEQHGAEPAAVARLEAEG